MAGGLPIFGGRTIVADTTLRSVVTGAGDARVNAASIDGSTFPQARLDKAATYPELASENARHKFLVLACELGGRFSEECLDLVHRLVTLKAQRSGEADGSLIKLLYTRLS